MSGLWHRCGRLQLIAAGLAFTTGLSLLGACSTSTSSVESTCGPVRTEPIDRRSLIHVLPGADQPTYTAYPPTSGPHQPSPPLNGVRDRPIDAPVQVGLLEGGTVLIQHRGLGPATRRELAGLAGEHVVVAPNAGLDPDQPVVATAWGHRQECSGPDQAALSAFADRFAGASAGNHR